MRIYWPSAHRTPEVEELVHGKGHVLLFHGGGVTPLIHVNDTHRHSQVARGSNKGGLRPGGVIVFVRGLWALPGGCTTMTNLHDEVLLENAKTASFFLHCSV